MRVRSISSSPRYPLGKLLKIFFIIMAFVIPLGAYYYYYAETKSEYHNQRNYRALNEVTQQLSNHLEAISKLFLFFPKACQQDSQGNCQENCVDDKVVKRTCEANHLYERRLSQNEFLKGLALKDFSNASHGIKVKVRIDCKDNPGRTIYALNSVSSSLYVEAFRCIKTKGPLINQSSPNNVDNRYFRVPISSLFVGQDPTEFDSLIIGGLQGNVYYQKNIRTFKWADDETTLQEPPSGTSVTDLRKIISTKSGTDLTVIDKYKEMGDEKNSGKSKESSTKPRYLQSFQNDITLSGIDYRAYIHPFKQPYLHKTASAKEPISNNYFYVIGLVNSEMLSQKSLMIPVIYSGAAFLLIIIIILAWPFLKLQFMGAKEAITKAHIRSIMFSLILTSVAVTILLLGSSVYIGEEKVLHNKGISIAETISEGIRFDINNVFLYLDTAKAIYTENGPDNSNDRGMLSKLGECWDEENNDTDDFGEVFSCRAGKHFDNITPVIDDKTIPPLRDIFSVNGNGKQYGPIIFFTERLYGRKLNVSFRDYYRKPRNGESYYWRSRDEEKEKYAGPYYIQRIYNYSDGQKAFQISIPLDGKSKIGVEQAHVIAATSYLPSLSAPVLPPIYNFALVDDATGKTIYHSEDKKSFVENFFAETEYNDALIAAVSNKRQTNGQWIKGYYHGKRTDFLAYPLNDMPWTLIVYQNTSTVHNAISFASLITVFTYFMYLVLIVVLIAAVKTIFKVRLNLFWPHPDKGRHYIFCIAYLFAIIIIELFLMIRYEGWTYFLWMVFLAPIIFIGIWMLDLLSNKVICKSKNHLNNCDDNALGRTLFAIVNRCWDKFHNYNSTSKRCDNPCRYRYFLFVTLIITSITTIPVIGLFEDTYNEIFKIHDKINQYSIAKAMDQRYKTLDMMSRMFYPNKYDRPINTGLMEFPAKKGMSPGIIGFDASAECSQRTSTINNIGAKMAGGTDPLNTRCMRIESISPSEFRADEYIKESRREITGPTALFLGALLDVNLFFAQQHAVGFGRLTKAGWRETKIGLMFTTKNSDKETHQYIIHNLQPGFWGIAISGVSGGWILVLMLLTWLWINILIFISKKVLGLSLPQPFPQDIISSLFNRTGPSKDKKSNLYTLIGVPHERMIKICGHVKKDCTSLEFGPDIYLDMLVDKLCLPEIEEDKYRILVITNLDGTFEDNPRRRLVLDNLERIIDERESLHLYAVFIVADVSPLYRLIKPSAYPFHSEFNESKPYSNREEIYRWAILLSKFEKQYLRDIQRPDPSRLSLAIENTKLINANDIYEFAKHECEFFPEMERIRDDLELVVQEIQEPFTQEQVIEYIRMHADAIYRRRWEACTRDERLALFQLANNKYINPENIDVIEHLHRRGYIERSPYFRIPSLSFKRFALTAEVIENTTDWEAIAEQSVWATLKLPLFVLLIFLSGILIYITSDTLDVALGLLTAFVAFVPVLLRTLGSVKSGANGAESSS